MSGGTVTLAAVGRPACTTLAVARSATTADARELRLGRARRTLWAYFPFFDRDPGEEAPHAQVDFFDVVSLPGLLECACRDS
jgi:hypothetical protein